MNKEKKPTLSNGILLRETNVPRYQSQLEAKLWDELIENIETGPINYWKQLKGETIAARKASWSIYNERMEDLNPYTNGTYKRRIQAQKKIRSIMKKK